MTNHQSLHQRAVAAINKLPPFPEVATKLIQIVNDPSVSASEVSQLISQDPSITSKVLRLANSAFYGIPRTITTVQSAIVLLGMKVVNSIVLGIAVNQTLSGASYSKLDQKKFWHHSLAVAICSKLLAPRIRAFHPVDPEEAFCAGLLHSIGQLVLDKFFAEEFNKVIDNAIEAKITLMDSEIEILGNHHGEIGGWLTSKWELPTNLRMPILYHHQPESAPHSQEITTIVAISNIISSEAGYRKFKNEIISEMNPSWFENLGLPAEISDELKEKLPSELDKLESVFL